jgi:phage gp36-like protein
MALATVDAVRAALNPDGGDGDLGSAAGMSTSALDKACAQADQEVLGRIRNRYPAMPAPAPDMLIDIAVDIAAYLATLTERRSDPVVPGHPVLLRYTRAQQLLAQIASGTIQLTGIETADSQAASDPASANPVDGQMFSPRDVGMHRGIDGTWHGAGHRDLGHLPERVRLLMAGTFHDRIKELAERVGHGTLTGSVEVDQVYAHYQHESLDLRHPRGGGAKYLEQPTIGGVDGHMQALAKTVLETGPADGMRDVVEDISGKVKELAPSNSMICGVALTRR